VGARVVDADAREARLGAEGGVLVGMIGVDEGLQGLLSELLVLGVAQIDHERVAHLIADAREVALAHARAKQHVAEQVVEGLEVIAVHLPDEDGLVAADVHVDRPRHRVEAPGQLGVREIPRAALGHEPRGEVGEPLAALVVGGRARLEGDAQRDHGRGAPLDHRQRALAQRLARPLGARLRLAGGLGQARILARRGRRPAARGQRERNEHGARMPRRAAHHGCPPPAGSAAGPCASVTTNLRDGVRCSRATRATSSGVTAASADRY
jgi:hypothetical protein